MNNIAAGKIWIILAVVVVLQAALWVTVRDQQTKWLGVPPLPSQIGVAAFTLGDQQFAYRAIATMLQNLGDTGGRTTNLSEYDHPLLAEWFTLVTGFDRRSNFIPYIAAYYYGAAGTTVQYLPLITYLRKVGNSPEGEKWRWLVQAIHLARYRAKDLNLAYQLALELSDLARERLGSDDAMPAWTLQMPAFVMNAKGEKEAALAILIETLNSSADKLHPNEVIQTRYYICQELLSPAEAQSQPLCQNIP